MEHQKLKVLLALLTNIRVFVHGKPSIIFARKARAYPSGSPESSPPLALLTNIRPSKKRLPGTNTIAS